MEEIHYKKRLEDLTNRELDRAFQNLFLENRVIEDPPEIINQHHEIVHDANPEDLAEPAESRNILFNYIMQHYLENEQSVARIRLHGGRQGKKSKRRKGRKSKKRRKSQRRR